MDTEYPTITLLRLTAHPGDVVHESYSLYKQLAERNGITTLGRQAYVHVAGSILNLGNVSEVRDDKEVIVFVKIENEPPTDICQTCQRCPWHTDDPRTCILTTEEVEHGNCVPADCPRRW